MKFEYLETENNYVILFIMESETQTHDQSSSYLLSSVNWPLVIFQSYKTETYAAK